MCSKFRYSAIRSEILIFDLKTVKFSLNDNSRINKQEKYNNLEMMPQIMNTLFWCGFSNSIFPETHFWITTTWMQNFPRNSSSSARYYIYAFSGNQCVPYSVTREHKHTRTLALHCLSYTCAHSGLISYIIHTNDTPCRVAWCPQAIVSTCKFTHPKPLIRIVQLRWRQQVDRGGRWRCR